MGKSNNAAQANSLAEAKCQTDFLVVRIKDGLVTKCLFSTVSTKGQLISKANCQAVNSSKKRTNEFIFTTMGRVFIHFLEEIEDAEIPFEIN